GRRPRGGLADGGAPIHPGLTPAPQQRSRSRVPSLTMRISRTTLLAALVAVLALALPATALAKRTVPRGWLGTVATNPAMLNSDEILDREVGKMPSVGVETLRFPVYWNDAQPWKRESEVPT